jgi:hypothetical protein
MTYFKISEKTIKMYILDLSTKENPIILNYAINIMHVITWNNYSENFIHIATFNYIHFYDIIKQ